MLKRVTILLLCLSLPLGAVAHEKEKNPQIRYRHAIMQAMSNNFAAMALIFTRKVDRPEQLQINAAALATNAKLIASLFPADSQGADALPLIWQEPDQVAEASQQAADAAAALAAAAAGDNKVEIAKAFKAAGKACKGCHERYRADDEEDGDEEDDEHDDDDDDK